MNNLISTSTIKPPTKWSVQTLLIPVVIFGCVFGFIIFLLNLPAITKNVAYSIEHTEEKDNQQLTDQYRALYGYNSHPELSYTALSGTGTANEQIELSIQKLDINAPALLVPGGTDADILAALKNGVVIYPGSALPGQTGTTVIIGHSSSLPPWTKYSAIFSKLGALESNDIIRLTYQGREYVYRVTVIRHGSAQEILNSGMTGDLILSTCWPVGTDSNRVAVAASRIQ